MQKLKLRKKILKIRKRINPNTNKINFSKIFNLNKKQKKTVKYIGGYFPVNSEIDDLEILQTPVLEAFTDNAVSMKTKLVTYESFDLLFLPVIKLNENLIEMKVKLT